MKLKSFSCVCYFLYPQSLVAFHELKMIVLDWCFTSTRTHTCTHSLLSHIFTLQIHVLYRTHSHRHTRIHRPKDGTGAIYFGLIFFPVLVVDSYSWIVLSYSAKCVHACILEFVVLSWWWWWWWKNLTSLHATWMVTNDSFMSNFP